MPPATLELIERIVEGWNNLLVERYGYTGAASQGMSHVRQWHLCYTTGIDLPQRRFNFCENRHLLKEYLPLTKYLRSEV